MSSVHSYTFNGLSRIGNDVCGVSERDMQNENFGSYLVQSYFAKNCGMAAPIDFATSQPNIFYQGSKQCGIGGCNIDTNSKLLIGSIQTNPKCRISLQERPFLTVPFLGRGPSMPVKESQLLQGVYNQDKKSCKTIMEKSIRPNQDLVPSLKASIQNPANLCEGIAADGWIRGGLPSRELSRDQDNFNRQ